MIASEKCAGKARTNCNFPTTTHRKKKQVEILWIWIDFFFQNQSKFRYQNKNLFLQQFENQNFENV